MKKGNLCMGKIYAISYGTEAYKKGLMLNVKSAYKHGADYAIPFNPDDIDKNFYTQNIRFFEEKKGGGYWLWKPYIIDKTLAAMEYGDWLLYVDAGLFYINDIRQYISEAESENITFVLTSTIYKEYQYTKRDVFIATDTDYDYIRNTAQRQSGALIIKKTEENIRFIKEWLYYIQKDKLVTDAPNELGKANYDGFVENRHDQSILFVLSKKWNIGVERKLYDPNARTMWSSEKLLCYHHTANGNKAIIWLKSLIGPTFHKVEDIFKENERQKDFQ